MIATSISERIRVAANATVPAALTAVSVAAFVAAAVAALAAVSMPAALMGAQRSQSMSAYIDASFAMQARVCMTQNLLISVGSGHPYGYTFSTQR